MTHHSPQAIVRHQMLFDGGGFSGANVALAQSARASALNKPNRDGGVIPESGNMKFIRSL